MTSWWDAMGPAETWDTFVGTGVFPFGVVGGDALSISCLLYELQNSVSSPSISSSSSRDLTFLLALAALLEEPELDPNASKRYGIGSGTLGCLQSSRWKLLLGADQLLAPVARGALHWARDTYIIVHVARSGSWQLFDSSLNCGSRGMSPVGKEYHDADPISPSVFDSLCRAVLRQKQCELLSRLLKMAPDHTFCKSMEKMLAETLSVVDGSILSLNLLHVVLEHFDFPSLIPFLDKPSVSKWNLGTLKFVLSYCALNPNALSQTEVGKLFFLKIATVATKTTQVEMLQFALSVPGMHRDEAAATLFPLVRDVRSLEALLGLGCGKQYLGHNPLCIVEKSAEANDHLSLDMVSDIFGAGKGIQPHFVLNCDGYESLEAVTRLYGLMYREENGLDCLDHFVRLACLRSDVECLEVLLDAGYANWKGQHGLYHTNAIRSSSTFSIAQCLPVYQFSLLHLAEYCDAKTKSTETVKELLMNFLCIHHTHSEQDVVDACRFAVKVMEFSQWLEEFPRGSGLAPLYRLAQFDCVEALDFVVSSLAPSRSGGGMSDEDFAKQFGKKYVQLNERQMTIAQYVDSLRDCKFSFPEASILHIL